MWGFTTVRDLGGPVMGLKQNIDDGLVPGPRIFPSLAFITQTGGHGDFRAWTDPHPRWFDETANWERLGGKCQDIVNKALSFSVNPVNGIH